MTSEDKLRSYIRSEIKKAISEDFPLDSLYYQSPGSDVMPHTREMKKRFENKEQWETYAKQLGATIVDRHDELIAVKSDETIIGKYSYIFRNGYIDLVI